MWEKVASRKHKAFKIFPFGPNSDEFMLYGTVQYGLKAGGESGLDWAARAHLVKDNGRVKMDFYQVYLVSIKLSKRIALTFFRILGRKTNSLIARRTRSLLHGFIDRIRKNFTVIMCYEASIWPTYLWLIRNITFANEK